MPEYRVADILPPEVSLLISPPYLAYALLTPNEGGTWSYLTPDPEELAEQEWHNQFGFMDPNERNKKMGLPPNYVVVDPTKGETLRGWVEKSFDNLKFSTGSASDLSFTGDFKGYEHAEVESVPTPHIV